MGKASKASGLVRFLAKGDGGDGAALRVEPDFVIRLNAETWDADNDRKCLGLIDHELMHCGVTIAGTYADRKSLVGLRDALGTDLVAVGPDDQDDKGRILVRYRKRQGGLKPSDPKYHEQPFAWRLRKHDVEAFWGTCERWGAWSPEHRKLYDVLEVVEVELPKLPFAETVAAAAEAVAEEGLGPDVDVQVVGKGKGKGKGKPKAAKADGEAA